MLNAHFLHSIASKLLYAYSVNKTFGFIVHRFLELSIHTLV